MLGNLLDLAVGLFSDRQNRKAHAADRREDRQLSMHQFDQQMDHSIRRRVEDAKRSGVHPLYALGASSGASPTLASGGSPPTGSGLSDAVRRILDRVDASQDKNAAARRKVDEADAALKNAQAAKISQDMASRGRDGSSFKTFPYKVPETDAGSPIKYGPAEFYKPEIPYSKSPGIRAGEQPGFVEVRMPDKRTVQIYDPDLGLDEIGQINYLMQRARHKMTDSLVWASQNLSDQALLGWLKSKLRKAGARPNKWNPHR